MSDERRWARAEEHLSAHDPVMAELISRHGPCTLQPDDDLFMSLCESIISQQVSAKAGAAITRRFKELFGGAPTPESLVGRTNDDLRSAGVSPQKAAYLRDLAAKCLDGTICLDEIAALPDDEVERRLLKVSGIGPWTVTMFLIFALNRTDVLPVGDLGIRRAVQISYGLAELPTVQELRQIASSWHPFETIASWYLWRSLDNK